jgi:signal peptidase I
VKHRETDAFWLKWCQEELSNGRTVHLQSIGRSMFPAILPKTLICIEVKAFSALEIGEIVVFQRNTHMVVHRVVGMKDNFNERIIFTQGDSNWHRDEPITEKNYVGYVKGKVVKDVLQPISRPHQLVLMLTRFIFTLYRITLRFASKSKKIFYSPPPNS